MSDDTAMAIPRLSTPGSGDGVALPRPLLPAAARLARLAFTDPATPLDALQDTPVIGHILAARLTSVAAHPSVEELQAWLDRFPALPDAPAIHAQLLLRLPRGATVPPGPAQPDLSAIPSGDGMEATDTLIPRSTALDHAVRDALRNGQTDRALRLVNRTTGLSPAYGAVLRAEIARTLFAAGEDLQALAVAEQAHARAHGLVGIAPWIGGLAAWRLGRIDLARSLFEAAWRAPLTLPGQRAGAAFWASRAALVIRGDRGPWLRRAARDPRTLYGLLARHMLGQPIKPDEATEGTLSEADVDAVAGNPRGVRALALIQVNQPVRAEAELRLLWNETRDEPGFGRSVLLVARTAGLTGIVTQLEALGSPAAVRFPSTRLRPGGGFRIDPALVYALTRLESNFDPGAVSPAGARGLMQLMPGTASSLLSHGGVPRLHDPATNLDLGQRLLVKIGGSDQVGPDLIRLLATYNAGTGNMARWTEAMPPQEDPLLYIESIPLSETRIYIARALAYTWLYAAQLHLPSPSLDELAAGKWPQIQLGTAFRDPAARLH